MTSEVRPRAGKIPAAIKRSGIPRSSLYKLRTKYPELFRKNGHATLIDFDVLDRVIDELPVAEIKQQDGGSRGCRPAGGAACRSGS